MLFASSPSLCLSQLFPFSLMKIKTYQKTKKKVLTHPNIIQTKEFSKTHTKKRKKKRKKKKEKKKRKEEQHPHSKVGGQVSSVQ